MMMDTNRSSFYLRNQASEEFDRLHRQAKRRRLWSALTGRGHRLLSLHEAQTNHLVQGGSHGGLRLVPIAQIDGSEGRCADFDADFRPLQTHTEECWISVAIAHNQDVALPSVELVQVGESYYVRDGHHRLSVAKMIGQLEIEAEVTVWRSGVRN